MQILRKLSSWTLQFADEIARKRFVSVSRPSMFKWLRRRNTPTRVAVIESLPVDGKRSVILVRRDNIEHLVMIGGRNDLVIEPNIVRRGRAAPSPARRPAPEWTGLPSIDSCIPVPPNTRISIIDSSGWRSPVVPTQREKRFGRSSRQHGLHPFAIDVLSG